MTAPECTVAVSEAILQLEEQFPDSSVGATALGDGGALVVIEGLGLGPPYQQSDTWVGFKITFQYPEADVYPHFIRGDLSRIDGQPLGQGMASTTFEERSAIQISRKSNRLNPAIDTASLKLMKVIRWLLDR